MRVISGKRYYHSVMYSCFVFIFHYKKYFHNKIQWNLSNPDTLGTEESVLVSEVSRFQGLNCTQTWHLGQLKVSCLLRCPHFRVS